MRSPGLERNVDAGEEKEPAEIARAGGHVTEEISVKGELKCIRCAGGGRDQKATRRFSNGTGICEDCFHETRKEAPKMPTPAIKWEEWIAQRDKRRETESGGGKVTAQIDWEKVQAERDAGVPVKELKKKYGVSDVTIYTRTHANGKRQKRTNERTNERSSRSKGGMNHGGGFNGLLSAELESLRKKRDALSEIIAKMEAVS
jgi:hypothetical protein